GLVARGFDLSGTEVAHDTVSLTGDERFGAAELAFAPGNLPVGEGSPDVAALVPGSGAPPPQRAPFVVSFSDQWAITNFDEMISLLRYFDRQDWVDSLRKASVADRPSVWRRFYKATDPVPMTPENEALDQYFRRVQTANQRFQESGDPGWLTDRGEVFITLGEPDDVFDFSSDVSRSGVRGPCDSPRAPGTRRKRCSPPRRASGTPSRPSCSRGPRPSCAPAATIGPGGCSPGSRGWASMPMARGSRCWRKPKRGWGAPRKRRGITPPRGRMRRGRGGPCWRCVPRSPGRRGGRRTARPRRTERRALPGSRSSTLGCGCGRPA